MPNKVFWIVLILIFVLGLGGGFFVRIDYDTGVRCVTAPCPEASDSTNLYGWISKGFPRVYYFSFLEPE